MTNVDGPSAILIKTIPHSRSKLFKCYCNSPVKVGGSIVDIKACADFLSAFELVQRS